jgi:fructose-specific phosphotransferase system component IIB
MVCAQKKILKMGINIETQGGEPSGNPVTVKKVAIPQGNLLLTDLQSGGRIEFEGVDITAGNLSAGGVLLMLPEWRIKN